LPTRLRLRPGTLRRVRTGTSSGQPVKIRFDWTDITATSARFEQAFSYIEGQSWQTNWILTMTRQD
jgi:hypothetical protein